MPLAASSAAAPPLTNARLCRPPFHSSQSIVVCSQHCLRCKASSLLWAATDQKRSPRTPLVFSAASLPVHHANEGEDDGGGIAAAGIRKIPLSDVVVMRDRRVYLGRKWSSSDLATALGILSPHLLCLFAPFTFTWPAFWTAFSLYLVIGLFGINVSYHRNLSHISFKLPKWLEYALAYCGVLALQGHPMNWVSAHRFHHQHCDTEGDPHSPTEGFWFSHVSWLFHSDLLIQKCGARSNVSDLEKQAFYRFMRDTYIAHPIALGTLLYAVGGFPLVVWGMGVRIVCVYHITWMVNSVTHVWGNRVWNTRDLSRNNWFVSLLALGEGWHNNHHAFEFSAKQGFEWWQIDLPWYTIRLLEALGLATDVKLPTQAQMERMRLKNSEK